MEKFQGDYGKINWKSRLVNSKKMESSRVILVKSLEIQGIMVKSTGNLGWFTLKKSISERYNFYLLDKPIQNVLYKPFKDITC